MRSRARLTLVGAACAAALIALALPSAVAVPGALTPAGCIQDAEKGECGPTQQGLDGAAEVAVSPDGRSVYVASYVDDAIVRFDRNPSTGALTPGGCIQDVGRTDCGSTQQGLDDAFGVAVSPDGRSVYVASNVDDAIVSFDRNTSTGALTAAGCIQDAGSMDCGSTQQGLEGAAGVAVSPDGRSVYVVSRHDSAIVRFDRDNSTGALTQAGCIQDAGRGDCGSTHQGLFGASGVAVSPDGRSVYVGSFADDAVVRFDRDTSTGILTPVGCIQDVELTDCGATQQGLDGANGVAVSLDGRSVYVVSEEDDAIVRFDRNIEAGALTPAGCIQDVGNTDCGATQQGLALVERVAVSPDGRSVYVASRIDHAIVSFNRDTTTGALSPAGCIQDTGRTDCGPTQQQGLNGARGVAVSPEGRSVYVGSSADDAIVRFDREPQRPETTIRKGPKKKTLKRKATFAFDSDTAGSTFECKLDKKDFAPCTSPKKAKVKPGRHTFQVRAIDPQGNADTTPAKRRWRVLKG